MMTVPGLGNANIRLDQPSGDSEALTDDQDIIVEDDAGQTVENENEDGDVVSIEHPDGSITISLDGKALTEKSERKKKDWFDNLVDDIDELELGRISEDLLTGVQNDIDSRKDWTNNKAEGLKMLGLMIELPSNTQGGDSGVVGQSRVRHPLLLEAVLRFQANARSEMLPVDGPVKIRDDNNESNIEQTQLADALEKDLNHYLTSTASEYYPDTDRMLLMLGFGGTAFKKIYMCPIRNRPVSESVDADDLIVNNSATDLANALRVTHQISMRASTVKRMQILGVYRDIDLADPMAKEKNASDEVKKNIEGIAQSESNPDDNSRQIYEIYCELDVKGFEHKHKGKHSGLTIPYRVTIDVSSRQILSIVRNYDEDTKEFPEAREAFVQYTFIPGLGFLGIGLVHILGNTTNAITAAWREMLDAGMFASFPGFLYSDTSGRQDSTIFRVPPGGGVKIHTGTMPISQAVMPLPYKDPSAGLMALVKDMAETGQRIGGTSELQVGEGRADAPVGTTLAMVEQATKLLNSVHKRMHAAQAREFQLLARCFKENPESFWQRNRKPARKWDEATFLKALEVADLVPQADPNTSSHSQRIMKIMALKQLQSGNPGMYDPIAIDKAALKAIGWSNPEQFMAPPEAQGKTPPEITKGIEELKIKHQDADAKTALTKAQVDKLVAETAEIQKNGGLGGNEPPPVDPMKEKELEFKNKQLAFQAERAKMDDDSRDADRAADEKIAQMELQKENIKAQSDKEANHAKVVSDHIKANTDHVKMISDHLKNQSKDESK